MSRKEHTEFSGDGGPDVAGDSSPVQTVVAVGTVGVVTHHPDPSDGRVVSASVQLLDDEGNHLANIDVPWNELLQPGAKVRIEVIVL